MLTCCQSIVPPVCRITTHTSVWNGQNYAFFGAGCTQYLRREVYWYSINDPSYYGRYIDARNRPPRSDLYVNSREGTASLPTFRQPITTISKTETSWIFTATINPGWPVTGLIRFEITLSDPLGRQEIVDALRNLSSQFDISAFENPASVSVTNSYAANGGVLTGSSVPTPALSCGETEAIVAGLIVGQIDVMDIRNLEFGVTTLITGSSQAVAFLKKSRLEMPSAWCSYYVPVSGLNDCRPIRDSDRSFPLVAQCATPVKTYYSSGGIVPLIAEQQDSVSPDYAVVVRCPGIGLPAPYPPCGP